MLTLNRNPLDLGCAYGKTPSKTQENKGQNGVRELRGRCSQTLQSHQGRDCPERQERLVSSLQFGAGHALSGNARSDCNHALVVVEFTVVERECSLVHVASRVLASVVRVGALPRSLVEIPERLNRVRVNVPSDVLTGPVINGAVNEFTVEADVAERLVGVERRTGLNPSADACLKSGLLNVLNDRGNDRTLVIAHDDNCSALRAKKAKSN